MCILNACQLLSYLKYYINKKARVITPAPNIESNHRNDDYFHYIIFLKEGIYYDGKKI